MDAALGQFLHRLLVTDQSTEGLGRALEQRIVFSHPS